MERAMQPTQTRPAAGEVPVRHVKFEFDPSTMAKYCFKDDAFSSAFILTFSTFIPHGERLVIDAVRARRDEIRDPELRERVTGLIGQESMHARVHRDFNAAYQAKGLPIDRIDRLGRWFFTRALPRTLSPDMLLAVTCAIEHVTAMMAEAAFSAPENADQLDPPARDFLHWHLLEECEHKSVAMDVYREVEGSELTRKAAMFFILATAGSLFVYAIPTFLATPGFSQGRLRARAGRAFWFGPRGYFAQLVPGALRYLRSDFHPDQTDTGELLETWRERLFGPDGELSGYVVKTVHTSKRNAARTRPVA